jgi:hypothetical protein
MAKIIPFGKNIYVEPIIQEQVLVSDDEVRCSFGKVLAIGEDVKKIKVGDVVGYEVFGVKRLEVNHKDNFFIPEDSDFLLCNLEEI